MKVELGEYCQSDQFSRYGRMCGAGGTRTTGVQEGLERAAGPGKSRRPGPQPMRSPPGAQNQTLRRLEQVLHADSGLCLPHLLSRLCQDLGPGAFRLAARMYLQKGRCCWLGAPQVVPWGGQG